MPLSIELRNHAGKVIGRAGESPPKKVLPLPLQDDSPFPLLRGVDLYEDTIFSSAQMRWLIPELEALRERSKTEDELRLVEEILELAVACREAPHQVLVFVGD